MEWLKALSRMLPIAVLIVQALLAWGMWSLTKKFVSREECRECQDGMQRQHSAAGERIYDLEKTVAVAAAGEHVTNDDLEKIYNRLNDVDRRVGGLDGELKTISRNLDIIHQHLLEDR